MPRTVLRFVVPLVVVWACRGEEPPPRGPSVAEAAGRGTSAEAAPAAGGGQEPGRPAVVFLGTSLTEGYGLSSPDSAFPARVGRMLDSVGRSLPVVNAGVAGATSAGGLRRIGRVLDRPVAVLVVELGANDGLRGQDPRALEANLQAIVDSTKARHPEAPVLLAGMEAPPNLGPDYTERFREVFGNVSARNPGVHLIPFLLEDVAGRVEMNQPDGIHPNARGHRRIAEEVWAHLEPLLERERSR